VENIAGYVYDHTTCDSRCWHQLEAGQRGPYFVSIVHGPTRAEFLRFVRLHAETHRCCDPLDGRVHSLNEVTRWMGIRELALRFIGLGVILGVFELVEPWLRREQESHEDMIKRLERENEARFRLKVDQVGPIVSISTGPVSRSGGAKTCTPNIVVSSSDRAWATVPRSASMTSRRDRSTYRNARQMTCPNAWPSGRSARPHRG